MSFLKVTFVGHFCRSLLEVPFQSHLQFAPWGAEWHNKGRTDNATYRLNQPGGRFNEEEFLFKGIFKINSKNCRQGFAVWIVCILWSSSTLEVKSIYECSQYLSE